MQSKQTKSRALLLSVLVVILCFAVILGATFALFTSKKEYGIGVNTGKIDVEGTLSLTGAWSQGQSTDERNMAEITDNAAALPQGGSVAVTDGNQITIEKMSLGDGAAFDLAIENKSTVNMKYSVSLMINEGSDQALLENLKFSVGGEEKMISGSTLVSLLDWTTVLAEDETAISALSFEIALPWSASEADLTDSSVSMTVVLEAVQANAYTGTISAGGQTQETLADAMTVATSSENGVVSVGGNVTAAWPTVEEMQTIAQSGKPVSIVGAGKSATTITAAQDEVVYIPANVTVKDVTISGEVAMETTASVTDTVINGNVTIAENAAQTMSLMSLTSLSEANGSVTLSGVTVIGTITATNANLNVSMSQINGGIAVSGGTLVLTNTTVENDNGSALTIEAGTTVTVTDSSLVASGDNTVVNNGTLTIGKGSYVDALTHGKGAVLNNKGGEFTLDGGTLTRSKAAGTYEPNSANGNSWYALVNNGVAYLNDGAIYMNDGYSSLIENGYENVDAKITISGGTYSGGVNVLKVDYGTAEISGGTFTNEVGSVLLNWESLTVSGGNFVGGKNCIITGGAADAVGNTVISGGTFSGIIGFYTSEKYPTEYRNGNYTITGGNFANAVAYAYTAEQLKVFMAAGIETVLQTGITFSSDTTFVLGNDLTVNGVVNFTGGTSTVDLNGYKLTINSAYSNALSDGANATIKNGDLVVNGSNVVYGTEAVFAPLKGTSFTLEDVTFETNGSAIFPTGDATQVNVINSAIKAGGVYGVGTNAATVENWGIEINIKGSMIDVSQTEEIANDAVYPYDNVAAMINVPGTLNIENSTLIADRQGLIVRGGTAVVKNTKIELTSNWYAVSDANRTTNNQFLNGTWSSGTDLPSAPIVVGNHHASSYQYAANCTLENVEVIKGVVGAYSMTHTAYVYGNASSDIGATLNIVYTEAYAGDTANKLTTTMQNKVFVGGGYTSINGGEMSVKSGWLVSDYAGINNAWSFGNKDLILADDILVDKVLEFSWNTTLNLDMNGKTMSFDAMGVIMLKNGADLTVTGNGTMKTISEDDTTPGSLVGYLFMLSGTSVLTIENGTYICGLTAVQLEDSATANIKGGTFSALQSDMGHNWILNKVDEDKDTATFNVTGGTFINFDPSNGETESPAQNFVADGYGVVASENETGDAVYKVIAVAGSDETFVASNAEAFRSLLGNGAAKVKVNNDITLSSGVYVKGEVEVDLNGKTIQSKQDALVVSGEANHLILRDSVGTGKVVGGNGGVYNAIWIINGGKVDIYGGTYTVGLDAEGRGNATIYIGEGNGICNIYGGTFMTEGPDNDFWYVLNVGQTQGAEGFMNVYGGVYVNYNPAQGDDNLGGNFVESGYTVEESTDGEDTIYTVVPVSEGSEEAQA